MPEVVSHASTGAVCALCVIGVIGVLGGVFKNPIPASYPLSDLDLRRFNCLKFSVNRERSSSVHFVRLRKKPRHAAQKS